MDTNADTLNQPEHLAKPFWGSVILHASFAALFLGALIDHHQPVQWGGLHGGGTGSIAITSVPTIKLPSENAASNPVANDTQSHVPEATPSKKKAVGKVIDDRDGTQITNPRATKNAIERAQISAPDTGRELASRPLCRMKSEGPWAQLPERCCQLG